jgi:hypothetical protein
VPVVHRPAAAHLRQVQHTRRDGSQPVAHRNCDRRLERKRPRRCRLRLTRWTRG